MSDITIPQWFKIAWPGVETAYERSENIWHARWKDLEVSYDFAFDTEYTGEDVAKNLDASLRAKERRR